MSIAELFAQLLGWLGEFVHFVFSFVPRIKIIRWNQRGVRYVAGKSPVEVRASITWYWPWQTSIDTYFVSRQAILVPAISVESADGVRMAIGCAITYRIVDVLKYGVENFNADENIGEVAMAGLREIATSHTAEELSSKAKEGTRFGDKLARRMGENLAPFGIEVFSCRPTDQVRIDRVLKHFGMDVNIHTRE